MGGFVGDFIRDPIGTTVDAISGAVDAVVDVAETVVDAAVDVVGEVVSWVVDIPEVPDQPNVEQQARSLLATKESTVAKIPVIYGERRIGGIRVFLENSGTDNKFLWMVFVLCEGQIESIDTVYADDIATTNSRWKSKITVYKKTGSDNQTAVSALRNNTQWKSSDRLRGLAYVVVRLEYDADVFDRIPNFTFEVKGRKVFDPRTSTTSYSNNPALCLRDYLTNDRYGKGLSSSLIDDDSFSDAADACDVDVQSGTKRFECNGVIDTGSTLFSNVKFFLSGMQGMMPFQNGQYRLIIEDDYDSTFDFNTDNIISGFNIKGTEKNKKYNQVVAKYINPNLNWQGDSVYWPATGSSQHNAFLSEDNNVSMEKEISLPMITNRRQAYNIAKTLCLSSRYATIQISFVATPDALQCSVGDVVTVTHPTPAWTNKEFRVVALSINFDATVNVSLVEHNPDVYPWADDDVEPETFESNLPDPFTVAAPSVTAFDELRAFNEEAITFLVVDLDSGDSFVSDFEVQIKRSDETRYRAIGKAGGDRFEAANVEDGTTYNIRGRAVNSLGVKSAWTTISHQVVGKTAPPSDVTGLAGNLIGNQYLLTWNPVADLDLSYYRIRYAESGTATYRESISLVPKVARPSTSIIVPARNGKYFVKAVDKLGIASNNAATIVLDSNIEGLNNLNVIETINEHPDFNGTFDDVVEVDEEDRLILDTSLQFDDVTGNFDDAQGLFDAGFGNLYSEGFYYFGNSADLGAIYLNHVTAKIKHVRVDYVNLFDTAQGLFDSRQGDFDGDPDAFDDTNAELQIRITQDDPTGTPTWSDWQPFQVGDYRFWGAEFRVKMTTVDPDATPAVSELTVTIDMPDRVDSANDLVTSSGVKVVTFPTAFKATPAIGIGAQDMQTGDFYEISSKSRTGFTITFKQSSGAVVSTERTFDYVAKGYGYEVT